MFRIFFILLLIGLSLNSFAQKPVITSFSPESGPVGSEVTIIGSDFNSTLSNNIVFVGGSKASILSATSTTLKILIPPTSYNQPISIINLSNGLQEVSTKPFLITFKESEIKDVNNGSFNVTSKNIDNANLIYSSLADIDGDGRLDLAIVNTSKQSIELYRNNSIKGRLDENSFVLSATINVALSYLTYGVRKVEFADLDGDGKLDLVITYIDQSKIGIYKNTSVNGGFNRQSFGNEIQYSVVNNPTSTSIADLDNDGKPEIICLGQSSGLSILKNISSKGIINTSSFQPKITLFNTTLFSNQSIDVGYIDNDNKLDLLVGNKGGFVVFQNTTINGNFSFSEKRFFSESKDYRAFLADLDGDNKKDVILSPYFNKDIEVFKNISSSIINFSDKIKIATSSALLNLCISDLNGDAKPDIVITPVSGSVSSFQNNFNGNLGINTFNKEVFFNAQLGNFNSIVSGDIDGDGKTDILCADSYSNLFLLHNLIVGKPKITSFNPTSAKKGETVSIVGKNFDYVTGVSFGIVNAFSFSVKSSTEITAVLAEGESGLIKVKTPDGIDSLQGFQFIGPPAVPLISFSPTSGATGEYIDIVGSGFSQGSAKYILEVKFGGVPAESFNVVSSTLIRARIAKGASGDITVSGINMSTGRLPGFIFIPKPTIDVFSIKPFSGRKGDIISISGTNFTGATSVEFGGVPASSFTVVSSSLIMATLGDGESGVIKITTPFGSVSTSLANEFTYIAPPPQILDFYPKKASAGDTITIVGTNFSLVNERNFVYFGYVRASIKSSSINKLVVLVPTSATFQQISIVTHKSIAYSKDYFCPIYKSSFGITKESFVLSETILNRSLLNAADFDNDGLIDMVIKLSGTVGSNNSSASYLATTSLYQNLSKPGQTSFSSNLLLGISSLSPSQIFDVNITDIDFNGKLDIGLIGRNPQANFTSISSWVTNIIYPSFFPDLRFTPSLINTYNDSEGVSTAINDFDVDGKQDLFFFSKNTKDFPNGTIGDLDTDGKPDIIVKNGNKIEIFKNNSSKGDIKFNQKIVFDALGQVVSIVMSDFNSDGKHDLAVLSSLANGSGILQILKNNSSSQAILFESILEININSLTNNRGFLTSGDLNGDGKIDLVIGLESKTLLLENESNNSIVKFKTEIEYPYSGNFKVMVYDIDGDSKADIVTSGTSQVNFLISSVSKNIKITDFNPKIGEKGEKIIVSGTGFTSAKSLYVGGREIKSFKVNSNTEIVFDIDTLASGTIRLKDDIGFTSSNSRFNYLVKPKLVQKDTVLAIKNYSFYLEPKSISGYYDDRLKQFVSSYTSFVSNDVQGSFIDQLQKIYISQPGKYNLSTSTPFGNFPSNTVYVKFIDNLPIDNFLIAVNSVSCKGSSNGSIKITNKSKVYCSLTLEGNNLIKNEIFDNEISFNNLPPGNYTVCINIDGINDYRKCYNIVISEPKDLSMFSSVNPTNNTISLQLSGASSYNVNLNGKVYSTNETSLTLPLKNGKNSLFITSDKTCQGVLEKEFFVNDSIVIYPNPVSDILNIKIGNDNINTASIKIYNVDGKVLYDKVLHNQSQIISLNLKDLNLSGSLILKLTLDNKESVNKFLKL